MCRWEREQDMIKTLQFWFQWNSASAVSIIYFLGHSLMSNWVNIILAHLFLLLLLQEQDAKPAPEPSSPQADPVPVAPAEPPAEVADETWEEKEDKQNAEPDRSKATPEPTGQKYQYKEGRLWLKLYRNNTGSFCIWCTFVVLMSSLAHMHTKGQSHTNSWTFEKCLS